MNNYKIKHFKQYRTLQQLEWCDIFFLLIISYVMLLTVKLNIYGSEDTAYS